MKRVVGPAGYTIVETMIFLGVSAVLFVSASIMISGRQRKTQFVTTVRDFSSKLESINGNVASGYYNSTGKVDCQVSGPNITVTSGGNDQGTSDNCIYLGQVLVTPPKGGSDFQIISLVGLRRTTGSTPKEVSNLSEANPRLYTDTAETYTLAGADFVSVSVDGTKIVPTPNTTDPSSIAFIGSLASYNAANGLKSGSSYTSIYAVTSGDTTSGSHPIESQLKTATAVSNKPIEYCLTNGEQNAKVTLIGGTTTYVIGDTSLCS